MDQASANTRNILFFGDSITAGYLLSPEQAFPALIQQKIDDLGLGYRVINAGVSGEATDGGTLRIKETLKQVPDIFVLELGANDGLRGMDFKDMEANLQVIIDAAKEVNPDLRLVVAGMELPTELPEAYRAGFRSVFQRVAAQNQATFIPFILEGVGGKPEYNLPDGMHPTAEGHKIIAAQVWRYLEPMVRA